ncbi:Uncharacterized protein SCF082_LOCUS6168, partial [Durusdinium trenchii]
MGGSEPDILKHLVPGSIVAQHATKTCKLAAQDCGLCAVQKAWKSSRKPWLRMALVDGAARFGCSMCAKSVTDSSPWAKFEQEPSTVLRKHNLDRHEKSRAHQMASASEVIGAPPVDAFKDCLQGLMQGQSARQGGVSSDKKTRMRYALSEAIISRNRKLISDAETLSLMRDERKGKLLVRFRAVCQDLTTVSGVLGFQEVAGSAESIALATGDLERGRRTFADARGEVSFRNIKVIGRDVAHASTRLLKRPFQACQPLKSIMTEWIHGSEGFAQKVHHSPVLIQWWAKAVHNDDSDLTGDQCTSMSAAKHRFSSYFNPLSRIVRNMQSAFQICGRVQSMRGAEAVWATKLCRNFNGFKAVLLAMVADAAAISNDYTRDCDREDTDIAQLNTRANHFVSSARSLFVERKVLTLPTFTKEFLNRERPVTIVQDGLAQEIVVNQSDLNRAFKEWVSLAEEVVAHEFPHWHLLSSFQVFHLSDSGSQAAENSERNLERMAQAFQVCPAKVKQQYARLMPIATALKKQSGMSNREAWKEAMQRTGHYASRYEATDFKVLLAVYQCWTASSSGVEQLSSKLKRSPVELSNAKAERDRRTAIVMGDGHSSVAKAEIISDARKIYASLSQSGGVSRLRTLPRFDTGKKGGQKKGSFAAWNRARKKAVQQAVQDSRQTPPRKPSALQTESSQKECDYQRQQALKRKAEALQDGLLLADEITLEVRAEAERVAKASRQQDRLRAKQRQEYESGTQLDLWHAKLVVVKNFTEVERNVQVMAALTGSALISADVLLGHGGVKLVYHPGHKIEAAVFATNTFKTEEPGMTALLREACARG